jgi:hypothetical protein
MGSLFLATWPAHATIESSSFCLRRVNQSFVLYRNLLLSPAFVLSLSLVATAHYRHTDRLKASFKTERDRTVAREFVFRQYQQFCIDQNIESTTQSAFGRILKDVFPGVRPQLWPPAGSLVSADKKSPRPFFCNSQWPAI